MPLVIGLVLLRLLAFLFSQWFVGVHTFLTCSTVLRPHLRRPRGDSSCISTQVKNVQDAKWVKVIPQAHKGSSEMCIVQRQVRSSPDQFIEASLTPTRC